MESRSQREFAIRSSEKEGFIRILGTRSIPHSPEASPGFIHLPGSIVRVCMSEIAEIRQKGHEVALEFDYDHQQGIYMPVNYRIGHDHKSVVLVDPPHGIKERLFRRTEHVASFHTHTPDKMGISEPGPSGGMPSDIAAFAADLKYAFMHIIGSENGLCAVRTKEATRLHRLVESNKKIYERVMTQFIARDYLHTAKAAPDGSLHIDAGTIRKTLAALGFACYWYIPGKPNVLRDNPPSDGITLFSNYDTVVIRNDRIYAVRS